MRKLLLPAFIFLTVVGCGEFNREGGDSEVQGASKTFVNWCNEQKLKACDKRIGKVDAAWWNGTVDVMRETVKSSSKITLAHKDLGLASVQGLINTMGARTLVDFVSKIPWQKFELANGVLTLTSTGVSQPLNFNGMLLVADPVVTIKFSETSRALDVKGIKISLAGATQQKLLQLGMGTPGAFSLVGETIRVDGVPVEFFDVTAFQMSRVASLPELFESLSGLSFDRGFGWQDKIAIRLGALEIARIRKVFATSAGLGAQSVPDSILKAVQTISIGGSQNVASGTLVPGLPSGLQCSFIARNVPVIGTANITVTFENRFGILSFNRTGNKVVATVYGITTSVGKINGIESDGRNLWLKVGLFTVPFELQGSNNGDVSDLKCG